MASVQQRRLRNYLIDKRLQLKFTAYTVVASLLAAALLGLFLLFASRTVLKEAESAVEARSRAAETSHELGNIALSNALFAHLHDPAFEAQLREKSRSIDQQFETEKAATVAQRSLLVLRQRLLFWVLLGALALFVLGVALASIVLTHRIAGPLYRIRRMVDEVAHGRLLPPPNKLRDSDELKELFTSFREMVESLRGHEAETVGLIELALKKAEVAGANESVLVELRALLVRMRGRLG